MRKYVFVTGGVCSSLGKGVATASLGNLLEERGFTVSMVKIDPYINVDAGTMSPFQHGEVYVTDDGVETDLDLGNYARFTQSTKLSYRHSITTGQVYQEVIRREREGAYLGKCVQVIPHITDEIKRRILASGEADRADIVLIEIGGTVGDIESVPFLETARQIIHDEGSANVLSLHMTLVPTLVSGEIKTKPTQHSVKEMREIGIQPTILLCRCRRPLNDEMRRKIALFTNVDYDSVFSAYDIETTIYEIPLFYHQQGLDEAICRLLGLKSRKTPDISNRQILLNSFQKAKDVVEIVVAGKYVKLEDAYKSIDEAIIHGAIAHKTRVKVRKVDTEEFLENKASPEEKLGGRPDGILVPGGFGARGIEGMLQVIRYAREEKIPFLGICLGMQLMAIEYCRTILKIEGATSGEFFPESPDAVIGLLEEQLSVTNAGATMRLGGEGVSLVENSHIVKAYQKGEIRERHRHRYEVLPRFRPLLEESGLKVSAFTTQGGRVEALEWEGHPWGVGVQFHPEFISRPFQPAPLFRDFIGKALENRRTGSERGL